MKNNENNPTIKYKLLKFIELKKLSKNDFYLKCGLSNGFLDKDRGFTTDNLVKILTSFPEIDVNWLLLSSDDKPVLLDNNSGNIHNNHAGGDILGNGATKTGDVELQKLIDAVSILTQTNNEQAKQIGELIRYITNK